MTIARYDGECICETCQDTGNERIMSDVDEIVYCDVVGGWVLEDHHDDCEECNG